MKMMELTNRLKVANLLSRYRRLIRFCLVGASGTIVGLSMLYFFTDVVGVFYLVSNVIAFTCSVTNNYLWNSKWTFSDKKASPTGYTKYIGTSLLGLGVNTSILWFLTSIIGIWYMASAIVAIVGAFLVNYTLSRKLVWTVQKEETNVRSN